VHVVKGTVNSNSLTNTSYERDASCQGGFKSLLKYYLDAMGHLHLSFRSIKISCSELETNLLMTSNNFLKFYSLLDFCLFDYCHLSPRPRIQ
jgi:hypothetical protein